MDEAARRRVQVCRLLELARDAQKSGQLSSVSVSFLKELVVNQNEDLLGADLSDTEAALNALKPLIMGRAKRSFEEVISTCSLERAHMLATNDARSMPAGTDVKSLVYGEIDFVSFYEVMQLAAQGHRPRSRRGAKFYDLGSGSGSAIFAACLAVDLRYAIGVELLESVHKVSLEVLQSFVAMAAPYLASPPLVKLYRGDFMAAEFDWTDADLVFAHSTCFEEDLLRRISRKAKRMRPGSRFVTFSHPLRTSAFRVIHRRRYDMVWGPATVFIHERAPRRPRSAAAVRSSSGDAPEGDAPPRDAGANAGTDVADGAGT